MDTSRREFLAVGVGATAVLAALANPIPAQKQPPIVPTPAPGEVASLPNSVFRLLVPGATDANGRYVLPDLPYPSNALEAVIDSETMELHHGKHHKAYVDGYNQAEAELKKARESNDFSLVEHWSRKATFHAGGHVLHCIFWDCMGPEATTPEGSLAEAIRRDFDSTDAMMKQFAAAAKAVEGSGWARLSYDLASGKLVVSQGLNQNLLTNFAEVPLLVLDVWEHAYYLRYQNRRAAYVDAFPKVIDWRRIGARFDILNSLVATSK